MRPSKLRLPDKTAVEYRSLSIISFCITGSNAPLIPLQVVQANPTIPKPKFSSSGNKLASSKYNCTALEPGAKEDFTHGLRVKPLALALRAMMPAAITLRGLLVLVHEVIAAIITAPSGIRFLPSTTSFSTTPEIPFSASCEVATRRCGFDGPAILRPTSDKLKVKTRSYTAFVSVSAHKPVCLAKFSTSFTFSSSRPVSFKYSMVCSSI